MRFFNCILLLCSLSAYTAVYASQPMAWLHESNERARQIEQKLKEEGILDRFLPESVEQQIEPYREDAQALSNQSAAFSRQVLSQYEGLELDLYNIDFESAAIEPSHHQPSPLAAIFVSFSMSDHELQEAFFEGEAAGAEIYFIGLHPEDKGIPQTMVRLRDIINNNNLNVTARFHPAAFDEFAIEAVPTLLYAKPGKVGLVSGVMSFDFLKERMEGKKGLHHLGAFGPTKPVIETSILDEIQARMNKIDFEQQKKAAIDNFWARQRFIELPDAEEDAEYYIDPTVRVTSDIVTPNGDVLARAGDVINPIRANPTRNTYLLMDAMNREHLRWATNELSKMDEYTIVMLMTSRIDREQGWDHLGALRSHFNREIYIIPDELIKRFSITGLPAIVSTDVNRHLLHIRQFNLKGEGN